MSKDGFRVVLGDWSTLGPDASPIREQVFVHEQNVPLDMEWDEMDAVCVHAVAYDSSGRPAGTGRLLPDGHIGRMAVLVPVRRLGVGALLLQSLVQAARIRGDTAVMLNAQIHAEAFYRRFGFVREGEEFMEAGIAHIHMRCKIAAETLV